MAKNFADMISQLPASDFSRYASKPDADAVGIAHEDLLTAPDHMGGLPLSDNGVPLSDYVCKMYATDVLRFAAMWVPTLISDRIIQDCQRMFPKCNAASRLNIVIILGLLRRADAVDFLIQVQQNPANDQASVAAAEAIQVIRGERKIGFGYLPGYINTHNPDEIVEGPAPGPK
ncbi:MAG: hypothetical protein RIS76_3303 [Verrucomicrobiota bacterium]|jgi:hypothetical protein